jgi:hypothetical protein
LVASVVWSPVLVSVATTVAPGSTPPWESVTLPVILPFWAWAAEVKTTRIERQTATIRKGFIVVSWDGRLALRRASPCFLCICDLRQSINLLDLALISFLHWILKKNSKKVTGRQEAAGWDRSGG